MEICYDPWTSVMGNRIAWEDEFTETNRVGLLPGPHAVEAAEPSAVVETSDPLDCWTVTAAVTSSDSRIAMTSPKFRKMVSVANVG
jgi:hypothetical protein